MKRYQVQSKYGCEIIFTYGDNGVLRGFELTTDVDLTTIDNVLSTRPPFNIEYFLQVCAKHKIQFIEIMPDVSFKAFWDAYAYKDGGSRTKAEASYNKLNEGDKAAAIAYIPKYRKQKQMEGVSMQYAVTYINQRMWIR